MEKRTPRALLQASKKNNAVAYAKSTQVILVGYPPRRTTVAQVNASVPRALPTLSTEATTRTKQFSCSSGIALCQLASDNSHQ
uniref:Uncharacterized protein n=1 Tax=Oryza glumipatula TaxID=40148 RepID=A0A0E0ANK1_9ORYZ